jgi:lysophospholipase L1-like esterase
MRRRIPRWAAAGLHAALMLVTAWLLAQLYLRHTNTLARNGRWLSSKVDLHYGILGAVSFLTTRSALHRNRLDLGKWHGYQELLYREPVVLEALELRVRLPRPGYVVALFDQSDAGFQGLRLSSDPGFPSACLAGTESGGFTRREPLSREPLDDRWHQLALRARDGSYDVTLDGRALGRCGAASRTPGRVGVRGSAARAVWVDDVSIRDARAGAVVVERFDNPRGARPALGLALAAVAALHGLARWARARGARAGPPAAALHIALLGVAGLALALELAVLGGRHPRRVDLAAQLNRIEDEPAVRARLRLIPRERPPGLRRLLWIGGSQTWGSGARRADQAWVARLEQALNRGARGGARYQCISAGIPAWDLPRLFELYRDEWLDLRPDVVGVVAGHNDRDPARFREALERLVELNRRHGIHTVFVPEPNTTESRRGIGRLYALHEVMREVARGRRIPLLEVHDYLVARRDDGFLWWDRVHLAPFGHALMAQRLYDQRARLLRAPAPRLRPELDQDAARAPGRG